MNYKNFVKNKWLRIKRVQAMALAVIMLFSICIPSVVAHAEETSDGICVHHLVHTAECGYAEASECQACTHVHNETCGYVEAVEGQDCTHICTEESGCVVTSCIHIHDETCGYIEGEEGNCTHLCTEESGCVTVKCIHTHDETCGYVEAVEGSPCTHVHDETCGYVEAKEASPCIFAVEGCPYCVVSWEWVDEQDALQESDGVWVMDMPGVSQDNPLTRDALEAMLPTQIMATTDNGADMVLDLIWDLSAIPEEDASSGTYLLAAALAETEENYALTADAEPLEVTLQLGGTEIYTGELTLPSGTPPYSEHIVNGVSPNGTVINLFDYWLTEQVDSDNTEPENLSTQGINKDHALLFFKNGKGGWNQWTGNKNPRTGIVQNTLVNGYPQLNLTTEGQDSESLAYLFDPDINHDRKASYEDVQGLLQVDDQGYYYYDSTENYAVYYKDTNSFTLYEYPGVVPSGTSPVGQFFPFNEANADATTVSYKGENYTLMNENKSTDSSMNHYFGLHMSTKFIQQNGGCADEEGKIPVTYEFSGDDDVWIFIDGVLVADLGGIHDAASVKIDFSTGKITINDIEQNETIGNILGIDTATLTDNTYHTLDFFYLERGNYDSNMYLKYNLVTIPESDLIKIDQLGDPVEGAQFTLYAADDTDRSDHIATGTTDGNGEFIFLRTDAAGNSYPITIDEL